MTTDIILADEPQTIELLQSVSRLMRALPPATWRRFLGTLAECSEETQNVVCQMAGIVEDRHATPLERQRAIMTIADALCLSLVVNPSLNRQIQKMDAQEAAFAGRLRELMTVKCVTQQELAERVGCSQPAISQMLNRKSRPQKKTILRLAEALQVEPRELWPDIEVAEMLDAVASFEQEDHTMTDAEAKALRATAHRNVAKIPVRSLPTRQH